MNAANPIVKRIDHIVFRTDDPYSLFSLFADSFQLPVVWEVTTHDFFTSGGVFAGNVYFEMMRFGRARESSPGESTKAEIWGIAFEPYRLRDSLDELRKRNIPHGPPFYSIGRRIDGKRGKAFTNVTLGKLLSDSRMTFYLGKRFSGNSLFNLALGKLTSEILTYRWADAVVSRAMDDTMIYICEYTHDNDGLRVSKSDELKTRRGGALGIECVKEVVLGVKNLEEKQSRWQNFLSPVLSSAPAMWQLQSSPAIRLVLSAENNIKTLVLKVTSLEKAKSFLAEHGLLGGDEKQQVCVEPSKIQGLDICLVE